MVRWSPEAKYYQIVSLPLAQQIANDFHDNLLISAGIACSINAPIHQNDLLLRDIRQMVTLGDEHGRDYTIVGSVFRS